MITFTNIEQVVRVNRNPSQASRHHFDIVDGKTLNHRSAVHFGIPGNIAKFVLGYLEIQLITKDEADAIALFFITCIKKSIPFVIQSDAGFNFGLGSGITLTGCRLQNNKSIEGMITPRSGKVKYDFRLDYVAGLQSSLISGTGVVSVGAGSGVETTFTDPKDDQVYPIIQLDDLAWLAKNYQYTGNGLDYDNDPDNRILYGRGRLYTYAEAVANIPTGWRLPTDAEWTALKALDNAGTSYRVSGFGDGTNTSGLGIIASGACYDGTFYWLGSYGTYASGDADGHYARFGTADFIVTATIPIYTAVRYVKDV